MMVATITKDGYNTQIGIAISYIIIQFTDNHFLIPYIVSAKVRINALLSVVAVLLGGAVWGLAGMFVSIPFIGVLKIIFDRIPEMQPWGRLLGDKVEARKVVRKSQMKSGQSEGRAARRAVLRRGGGARLGDQVRDEAAEVVGDEVVGFADAHAGGFLADDPAAEDGVVAVEIGEGEELLIDMSFGAIFAAGLLRRGRRTSDLDIGAFAGEDGFADKIGEAVRFEVGGQEPGAVGVEFPQVSGGWPCWTGSFSRRARSR